MVMQMFSDKKGKQWKKQKVNEPEYYFIYQRVFEGDQFLLAPFCFKHASKVLGASAQDTSVSWEYLSMDQELDIAVLTLLQQPVA